MEQENQLAENTLTNGVNESNSQSQVSVGPVASPPRLTMETAGGIEPLYKAFLQGKTVELPPWLVENEERNKNKELDIIPQEIFIYIMETEKIRSVRIGNSNGIFLYKYNKEKGVYEHWAEINVKSYIKSLMPIRIRKPAHWEWVYKELTTEAADTEESDFNSNENIINFQNGIVDLTTGKLLPHSSEYLSTIQIPCNYIENAKLPQAQVTLKFLQTITGNNPDDMFTFLEVWGAGMSNVYGWRFKKLIVLKGPGDTGKSVAREYITDLIGQENCFTVDIAQLNSRFGTAGILGKRIVGSGDLKYARVSEMDKIKELTGRRPHKC